MKTPRRIPIAGNLGSRIGVHSWRLLPVLTGLLLAAAFPLAGQGFLAWIAFFPLVAFVSRTQSVRGAFCGGFVAGYLESFVLLVWMPEVLVRYGGLSPVLAWIAYGLLTVVLACFPGVACGLTKFVVRRAGERFLLVFPCVWVLLEYAQSVFPFGGLPWLTAGYTQSRWLHVVQIADITGVYGISFLLVWTGVAIYLLFRHRGRGMTAWAPCIAAGLLLAGSLVYGRTALRAWDETVPRFRAAMLQANLSLDEPGSVLREKFRFGYSRMADRVQAADLLLLPESPSPILFESDEAYRESLERLARRFPLGLVFNNVRREDTPGEPRYFNSAYFLDNNGALQGVYDKIHLVPFGEYLPLANVFSFVEVISRDVGAFAAGDEIRIIAAGGHPASAIICFEAVFPGLVRRFVRSGSELIVNLTNDGWYGDSAAPYQHLEMARFRAVENRRYFLRATNSGISALIEPGGRVQASTGILREAICEGRFDFVRATTFYTRYGDVFVFLCAIISCASLLVAVSRAGRVDKEPA